MNNSKIEDHLWLVGQFMKKFLICITMLIPAFAFAQTESVIASGHGNTEQEALKNAFVAATEQVVGVMVSSKVYIENGKLINEQILTKSEGFIKNYEKLSVVDDGGLVKATISAEVATGEIKHQIEVITGNAVKIDGKSLYAEMIVENDNYQYIKKNLAKILEDKRHRLNQTIKIKPTNIAINHSKSNTNETVLMVDLELSLDKKKWHAELKSITDMMVNLGSQLVKSKETDFVSGNWLYVRDELSSSSYTGSYYVYDYDVKVIRNFCNSLAGKNSVLIHINVLGSAGEVLYKIDSIKFAPKLPVKEANYPNAHKCIITDYYKTNERIEIAIPTSLLEQIDSISFEVVD